MTQDNEIIEKTEIITKKDLNKVFLRWHFFTETSLNFERLQALAFCYSISGVLEKLYPNKKDLSEALQRHLNMYNTQGTWGGIINGITVALEEKISQDPEHEEDSKVLVTGLKTGLMGPIAGIGDTLDFGTLRPIVIGLCVPFVMQGSIIAAFVPLIWQVVYMGTVCNIMVKEGYEKGKESIVSILQSGRIHKVINGAGMFGLLMMGALSATYVKITTPLTIVSEAGTEIVIQDMLDKIVPNMLPIAAVFAMYFYFTKKGPRYIQVLLYVIVLSLVFSFLGIL
ncbi:MAG: PTS system mannose/fructose/sorbose family transporter subunit IID [Erysipelotrichaceae bacterium]|nr:PTS system mannose/fructose/sorbose family transporter subunit IID [Erysipelotrichaceae bacterium]